MKNQVILLLGVCAAVAWGAKPRDGGGYGPPPVGYGPPHGGVVAGGPPHGGVVVGGPPHGGVVVGHGGGYGGGGFIGGGGGKGKGGGGKGDDYSHIDFGPARYTYQPVTHYREIEVKRPVTVYEPSIVKQPYVTYKKVLQPPPPKLIKKPVVTHTQEWRLVPVPKVTYQQIWVHPYFEEEKVKESKGWFDWAKGSDKGKDETVVIVEEPGYGAPHPAPHHIPHPPQQGYGAPLPAPHHPPQPGYGPPPKGHH